MSNSKPDSEPGGAPNGVREKQENVSPRQGFEGRQSLRGLVIKVIAALGILGAVGSYFVPRVLASLEERLDTRPPIAVDAPAWKTENPKFVFPSSVAPESLPTEILFKAANDHRLLQEWAQAHEGAALGNQVLEIVLRGRDKDPVVINTIEVVVENRAPMRAGWFNTWDGCGSGVQERTFVADLSSEDAVKAEWTVDGVRSDESPTLKVTDTDIEVLEVSVSAPNAPPQLIEWTVALGYSSKRESDTLLVDAGDRPFRLAPWSTAIDAKAYGVGAGGKLVRVPNPLADEDPESIC